MKIFGNIISLILKLALFAIAPLTIMRGDSLLAVQVFISLFIAFLPQIIGKVINRKFPAYLDILVAFTLFAHNIGVAEHFYARFGFYSDTMHFFGSAVVVSIIYFAVEALRAKGKLLLGFGGTWLITAGLGLCMGAIWEIIEYGCDVWLHINAQKGNVDTMNDLVWDMIAAMVIPIFLRQISKNNFINNKITKPAKLFFSKEKND